MTQGAVIFNGFPHAGLAQLVERWFCNPPLSHQKSTQIRRNTRLRGHSGCEISVLAERSAARKSAQSKLSDFDASQENQNDA